MRKPPEHRRAGVRKPPEHRRAGVRKPPELFLPQTSAFLRKLTTAARRVEKDFPIMSSSGEEGAGIGFETARDRDWPSIRQFNVFLENRLGALQNLVRRIEASQNRILSLTIWDSADCAIIRIVPTDPERATEILQRAKLAFTESDLLVVQMPDDPQPLVAICKTLLAAELNVHYMYPLLVTGPDGRSAIALHVENIDTAAMTLDNAGLKLYSENDFKE